MTYLLTYTTANGSFATIAIGGVTAVSLNAQFTIFTGTLPNSPGVTSTLAAVPSAHVILLQRTA